MGRHSAPEDEQPSVVLTKSAVSPTTDLEATRGRHETEDDEADTTALPRIEPDGEPAERPTPTRTESGTHGDLRLLRERPALRARCAAAAIVPFLLYTAMLAVIGRPDIYLLWVWIPTVTAGIAVGGFLDAAHRHDRKRSVDD